MSRLHALALLALLASLTATAFAAPWPVAGALAAAALVAMRAGRRAFALLALVSVAMNVAVVALVQRGWGVDGLAGGLRLAAAVGGNLAVLSWWSAPRLLDALRLPPRATALLAAVLLAARDVADDLARLRTARRLEGAQGRGRWAAAREAASLLGPLFVGAQRRAATRRDALQVAGVHMPGWFVPFVAVAALCAAGRLVLLAFPNVALSYVVAFAAGLLLGPVVAAAGAFVGMALTDLLLTGLYLPGFVNAPAMAILALLGGALRRVDLSGGAGRTIAWSLGVLGTLAFSAASDLLTWALLYPGERALLAPFLLAGLAFNVVPALVNGALFAWSLTPMRRAFDAARGGGRAPARAPRAEPASARAPPPAPGADRAPPPQPDPLA